MADRKQRVSLCMIVRNEQQNLKACLAPVADLFDEIVITDTGSHDRTIDIARRFTPHVHHFSWCDDFAAARNEGLRHATGDWIFWLDADDRVRPSQVDALRQLFEQLDDQPRIFMLTTILPPPCSGQHVRCISHARLFQRDSQLHWRGRVHERLTSRSDEPTCLFQFVPIEIEHLGYLDRETAERKARRNLRLLRMDYAENPDDPNTCFNLGIGLYQARQFPEATRCLLKLLNSNCIPAYVMRWIYDAMIEMSLSSGNQDEAARWAECGLAAFPDDEYLLYGRAKLACAGGDYQSAVTMLNHAMRAPDRIMQFDSAKNLKNKLAPYLLSAAYQVLGNFSQAEVTLKAVVSADPRDCEALFNLGLIYLHQGRRTQFTGLLQILAASPEGICTAKLLTTLYHLRHGDLPVARRLLDDLIQSDPHLFRARVMYFELLLRSHAPLSEQICAINDILRLAPGLTDAREWLHKLRQLQHSTRRSPEPVCFSPAPMMTCVPAA